MTADLKSWISSTSDANADEYISLTDIYIITQDF